MIYKKPQRFFVVTNVNENDGGSHQARLIRKFGLNKHTVGPNSLFVNFGAFLKRKKPEAVTCKRSYNLIK